jgi:hypothetical protein
VLLNPHTELSPQTDYEALTEGIEIGAVCLVVVETSSKEYLSLLISYLDLAQETLRQSGACRLLRQIKPLRFVLHSCD